MAQPSLLDQLHGWVNIDVDDADIDVVTSVPCRPQNVTSNQAIATKTILLDKNRSTLLSTVHKHGSEGAEAVYTNALICLLAEIVPHIDGRVLIQASPRYCSDEAAIVKQCHEFDAAFAALGISRNRYAIKLPFTGAAASAATKLNAEGIRTLATAVFCLEQAVAASHSKCLFISPDFNEIAAYTDRSRWPDVVDPALEHPMSSRVLQILDFFAKQYANTGTEQPIMVIASHFTVEEVMAMAELGCQHITISASNLKDLEQRPALPLTSTTSELRKSEHPHQQYRRFERLAKLLENDPFLGPLDQNITAEIGKVDYLNDGGRSLDEAIARDPIAKTRMDDALKLFADCEDQAKVVIEQEIEAIGRSV
ncbi:Putative transaldolase/Fructose-6-phosphate aldolase, aldolase-type TIM barrel [Septoria linicola]|uniref:Transaldolase/Fructose-6-phosphate aldolase, aldolase-type TIM barrel n=1 Tax=Septoria linicola TaxID=215465 RepID=A0A9Q9EHC2_9PEZI|nr:putative transaldolase/Fructose-6-phosphate aldolase, aldolase-type TIM barrel [Septoria linicola]USW50850.1 Putative transaldolase/Fructose-6-phosphate aldolase, aldolase-type TIM barrel [Septoria linicola]